MKQYKAITKRIFNLVAKLSKSEKSYINKNLTVFKEDSDMLYFFEQVCKMNTYDNERLKQIFNDDIKTSNIINQLVSVIAKSIYSYNKNKSQRLKVYQYLIEAEVFMSKEAYDFALISIQKGLDIAIKSNNIVYVQKFRLWLNHILTLRTYTKLLPIKENLTALIHSAESLYKLTQGKLFVQYIIFIELHHLIPYDGYKVLLEDNEFSDLLEIVKVDINNIEYNNYCALMIMIGQWEKSYTLLESAFEFSFSISDERERIYFLPIYLNILELDIHFKDEAKYRMHFTALESLISNFDISFHKFQSYKVYFDYAVIVEFLYAINFDIHRATGLLPDIDSIINNHSIAFRIKALKAMMNYCIRVRDYEKALIYIKRELFHHQTNGGGLNDVYFLKWIEIFCFFEQNEESLLESRMLTLRRFIEKYRQLNVVEQALLKLLARLKTTTDHSKQKKLIEECITILIQHIEIVRSTFDYFDVVDWLGSQEIK